MWLWITPSGVISVFIYRWMYFIVHVIMDHPLGGDLGIYIQVDVLYSTCDYGSPPWGWSRYLYTCGSHYLMVFGSTWILICWCDRNCCLKWNDWQSFDIIVHCATCPWCWHLLQKLDALLESSCDNNGCVFSNVIKIVRFSELGFCTNSKVLIQTNRYAILRR